MLFRTAAVVCLLAATAAAQDAADPNRPIDLRYAGKYRDDPWFTTQPERFRRAAEEGFRRAAAGLGIDRSTLDLSLFRVYMSDARSNGSTWPLYTRPWMECSGYPGDAAGIELRITTESMRNGFAADLAQGMTHELTHALMRATCPGYRTVPKWIREGMAVFIAGQGPGRMTMHLSVPKYAANPRLLCNGLEEFGGTHTLRDYTEDYLAMVYLEQTAGAGAVKKLQAALAAGTDWRAALETVSGMKWPEFQTGARVFAHAELEKQVTPELRAFAEVATLRMSGKFREAIPKADAFIAAYPRSPFRKMAHYHRARALHRTKQYRRAIADFAAAYDIGTPFSGYDDDLLFWWGWDLYKTGQYAEAAKRFEELLRDHPAYNDPVAGAFFWALSLAEAGDPRARGALTKVMAAYPTPKESWMMPAAQKALAKVGAAGRGK